MGSPISMVSPGRNTEVRRTRSPMSASAQAQRGSVESTQMASSGRRPPHRGFTTVEMPKVKPSSVPASGQSR
jgi:hypothetical protein